MLRRVLVPLDGSLLAQMALDFATHMVGRNCEITLLTAIQIPDVPIYGTYPMVMVGPNYNDVEAVRKAAQQYLESVADSLREQELVVHIRVEIGEPAQTIVQIANTIDADVIIMSTHGRSGISRWLFGSVTGKVLSMATRPVLVVPSQEFQQKFEREVAEVNFG